MDMQPNTPPGSYEDLKTQVAARYDSLSKRLQQVGRFVLGHPNDIALETIAVIAQRAEVQPSTLIRFAKAMHYDGFTAMQRVFRDRLVERMPSYSERIHAIRREHGDGIERNPLAVLRGVAGASIVSLEHLCDETAAGILDRAIALLDGAREIHVLGQRRSFPIAFYLSYGLNRLGVRAHLLDGAGGMVFEQAETIAPEDVLLAVSFRDYAKDVVEIVKRVHGRGIHVVAITDSPTSPLVGYADACFEIHDADFQSFRSLAASMCLAQALVIGLGYRIETRKSTRASSRRRAAGADRAAARPQGGS